MTAPGEHGGRTADEVWEPVSFQVGQRVRVRFNLECLDHVESHDRDSERADGKTGTVIEWHEAHPLGHPITVAYDEPWWSPEFAARCVAGHWAASELVPVPHDGRDISTDAAGEEVR